MNAFIPILGTLIFEYGMSRRALLHPYNCFYQLMFDPRLDPQQEKVGREQRSQEQTHTDFSQKKAHKRVRNLHFLCFYNFRNQQVACSSHVTSSNNKGQSKDWPLLLETLGIS